MSLLAVVK